MTAAALLDLILSYTDNTSATDADNAVRRTRVLQALQEIYEEVWNFREWRFKLTSGTITVLASTSAIAMPSDFLDMGSEGAIYGPDSRKLREIPAQELLEWRTFGIGRGSPSDCFSIFNFDATSGLPLFQIPNVVNGNTAFTVWYNRVAPTVADSATAATSKLHFIPVQYHNTVLLPGVVAKIRKQKGDTRDWAAQYQSGLAYMVLRERPRKTAVQQMPRAIVGSW